MGIKRNANAVFIRKESPGTVGIHATGISCPKLQVRLLECDRSKELRLGWLENSLFCLKGLEAIIKLIRCATHDLTMEREENE